MTISAAHTKHCIADLTLAMSSTFTPGDMPFVRGLMGQLRQDNAGEMHGSFVEDGDSVVFTGTNGYASYELRVTSNRLTPLQRRRIAHTPQAENVLPFPAKRRPPFAIPIAIPEAVMEELKASLDAEIEKRGQRNEND